MRTRPIPRELAILLVSLWVVLTTNRSFWQVVLGSDAAGTLPQPLFLFSVFVLVTGLVFFIFLVLAQGPLFRFALVSLLLISAATSYFMDGFGIVFDADMLENVVDTNFAEASELLSPGLFATIALLGLLPAIWVLRLRTIDTSPTRAIVQRLGVLLLATAMIVSPLLVTQKEIFSLARNNKQVRHLIAPLNVVSSAWRYGKRRLQVAPGFRTVGEDAHRVRAAGNNGKPVVHVLIVGETARAANFSLGSYERDTNPQLGKTANLQYAQAASCGTATATSLPCMFSIEGHDQYDARRSKHSDNLLDIAQRAGYRVIWLDNGNSCKGVCARVEQRDVHALPVADICPDGVCFDEILVHELNQLLPTLDGDTLIVLHQLGSHGPAYYRRYPESFRHFTPDCRSPNLGDCSDVEIVNAYDNTIFYTDHIIASVIDALAAQSQRFDVSMTYMSDHGESLGEGNLYLHGMPYRFAPEQQTTVPFMRWSPGMNGSAALAQMPCRDNRGPGPCLSHDNLFHTELGLLGIGSTVYDSTLDVASRHLSMTLTGSPGMHSSK